MLEFNVLAPGRKANIIVGQFTPGSSERRLAACEWRAMAAESLPLGSRRNSEGHAPIVVGLDRCGEIELGKWNLLRTLSDETP